MHSYKLEQLIKVEEVIPLDCDINGNQSRLRTAAALLMLNVILKNLHAVLLVY